MAAAGCCSDGLTIYGVGNISSYEYSRHLSAWCSVNLLDVAHFVGIEPLFEYIAIGLVSNGEEETIDGNVNQFLVSFALSLHKMCAFHSIFTKQSNGVVLEKNLDVILDDMRSGKAAHGIVVDPDVDRLAFICENGEMFGEEYTLVSVADYVLQHTPGNTVSNLSSTRALRDVTERHGGTYTAAAVGEVNVTTKMKEVGAVIGGEGNGGVIYPESHYGRDALVGIALFLSSLAHKKCTASQLRATFPNYFIAKNRIDLTPSTDIDAILEKVKEMYASEKITDIDGVKIDFPDKWVHLRKSNTEPIIRVYSEAATMEEADALGKKLMQVVYDMQ